MGEGAWRILKRDAKPILGERGPCKNQLRERTKFHGEEEIRGHEKIPVSPTTKPVIINFSLLLSSFQLLGTNSEHLYFLKMTHSHCTY